MDITNKINLNQGQTFEDVAQKIIQYIEEYNLDLAPIWPEDAFISYSYSRWTAEEMLAYLLDHPFGSPIDVLEDFVIKLTYYSHVANDERACLLFETAAITAGNIVRYISEKC